MPRYRWIIFKTASWAILLLLWNGMPTFAKDLTVFTGCPNCYVGPQETLDLSIPTNKQVRRMATGTYATARGTITGIIVPPSRSTTSRVHPPSTANRSYSISRGFVNSIIRSNQPDRPETEHPLYALTGSYSDSNSQQTHYSSSVQSPQTPLMLIYNSPL